MAKSDINVNISFTWDNDEKIKRAFADIDNYCKSIPLRKRVILRAKRLIRKIIHRRRNKRLAVLTATDVFYGINKKARWYERRGRRMNEKIGDKIC